MFNPISNNTFSWLETYQFQKERDDSEEIPETLERSNKPDDKDTEPDQTQEDSEENSSSTGGIRG